MQDNPKIEDAVIVEDTIKPIIKEAVLSEDPKITPMATLPSVKDVPTPKVENKPEASNPLTKDVAFTLRSIDTGDRVFLIKGGQRFWVMNPETLAKLGFRLGQERTVSYSEMAKYPEGEALNLAGANAAKPEEAIKEAVKKSEAKAKEAIANGNKPFKVWE